MGQGVEKVAPAVPANGQGRAAHHDIGGGDGLNEGEIDEVGIVDAEERVPVEFSLDGLHGLAAGNSAALGMDDHMFALGLDVEDFGGIHEDGLLALLEFCKAGSAVRAGHAGALHDGGERPIADGLDEEAHGLDGVALRGEGAVVCHEAQRSIDAALPQAPRRIEAVEPRHVDVEEHKIGIAGQP